MSSSDPIYRMFILYMGACCIYPPISGNSPALSHVFTQVTFLHFMEHKWHFDILHFFLAEYNPVGISGRRGVVSIMFIALSLGTKTPSVAQVFNG